MDNPKFPKRGSFQKVYEVRLIWLSDTRIARKRIFRYDEEVSKRVEKEVEIFAKFSHPHATPLLGSYTHRMELYLLLQLAERNFADFFCWNYLNGSAAPIQKPGKHHPKLDFWIYYEAPDSLRGPYLHRN